MRDTMEQRFGTDFSAVRIHTDSQAATAARDINSDAFTNRQHIYFGSGRFQPETPTGQRLLAHELAHTIQQRSTTRSHDIAARAEAAPMVG
ncbi:MAG TPA: DUF4157 domain-containing protein, partial [Herpetosiphonaceae bacterium]